MGLRPKFRSDSLGKHFVLTASQDPSHCMLYFGTSTLTVFSILSFRFWVSESHLAGSLSKSVMLKTSAPSLSTQPDSRVFCVRSRVFPVFSCPDEPMTRI
ncbi:MAG: hypothetical protein CMM07_18015 [Rhodopirellula sp.]|nr:hypothetical protein [Rhodopirellula sp.]